MERVRTENKGGADFVFNATGRAGALATAVQLAGGRATVGFVGGATATEGVDWSRVMNNGQTIRGVVQGDSNPHVLIPALATGTCAAGSRSTASCASTTSPTSTRRSLTRRR